MSRKILVPVDFSKANEALVSWAASLARDRKASLILLHVQEPIIDPFVGEVYFPLPLEEKPAVRESLLKVRPEDSGVHCEHRLVLGAAPSKILEVAAQEQVELIVMGSHGRGWLGRALMGSVAEHVMRHATCPVLIVKASCGACAEPESVTAPVGQSCEAIVR